MTDALYLLVGVAVLALFGAVVLTVGGIVGSLAYALIAAAFATI